MTQVEEVIKNIDVHYAYEFAKKLETFKCNAVLGYRTAGSRAELQTGNLIYEEMKKIGLDQVVKDEITLDSWEFQKAKLSFTSKGGKKYQFELGAYQTQFNTNGPQEFSLVYVGKGTAEDYMGIDVRGKLVLVDINQREEWWINYPVYEAYLHGAAALIAVQESGYGQIDASALNAQDIAGPSEAAAFSISRQDAEHLKADLREKGGVEVVFDAVSTVKPNQKTYNIVGRIEGKYPETMILLSAHYDSYFNGFQDDNVAIAMMLGIARGLKKSGYKPERTLIFCAMAAEEWGVINSKYDWSTGAYEELFSVHPEWKGKVIADINFELPAHAHDTKDRIRCVYEYEHFISDWVKHLKIDRSAYPDGLGVTYPIETWSDDFTMAIFGIPSIVNDFSSGSFMETHYHSQFDNGDFYNEAVYVFHHVLYAGLLIALDETVIAPLNFYRLFCKMRETFKELESEEKIVKQVVELLVKLQGISEDVYSKLDKINKDYKKCRDHRRIGSDKIVNGESINLEVRDESHIKLEKKLLELFAREQDELVRLNWHDEVYFPHELINQNLQHLNKALTDLKNEDLRSALGAIYEIDNNRYAFLFDKRVYEYFTDYVLKQPVSRLKWGNNRIIGHENLFHIVRGLKEKIEHGHHNVLYEITYLEEVRIRQQKLLREILIQEKEFLNEFYRNMEILL